MTKEKGDRRRTKDRPERKGCLGSRPLPGRHRIVLLQAGWRPANSNPTYRTSSEGRTKEVGCCRGGKGRRGGCGDWEEVVPSSQQGKGITKKSNRVLKQATELILKEDRGKKSIQLGGKG